ncbi:ArnT family glycosyltransferase [Halosimplex halobium]|uniref:ArnT family glycosyltransferase n=1 Tax=Halosimplex halobium TaxID=3396618 RepID=UPI003F545A23
MSSDEAPSDGTGRHAFFEEILGSRGLDTRRFVCLVCLAPAVALLPLLTAKIPVTIHGAREIAGYFQALGFVRTGLESYLYLTPEESFSALHLHSLLSAPLVAAGYHEGGRLISLLAAVGAAGCVALIARQLAGDRAMVLAPAVLWANPAFVRHAWVFEPDSLSIALTCATVYCALEYVQTNREPWFAGTAVLLVLGITNHMWEATVALPVVVLLATAGKIRRAAGLGLLAGTAILGVLYVTGLQPEGPSSLTVHGTQTVGIQVFVSSDFWLAHLDLYQGLPVPYGVALTILLPVSVLACGGWLYRAVMTGSRRAYLLASWTASGLAIPVLLAHGYLIHYYYLWGLFAPVAVTVAVCCTELRPAWDLGDWLPTRDRTVRIIALSLVTMSMLYAVVFQVGALGGSGAPVVQHVEGERTENPEATRAGRQLAEYSIDADDLVFVGDWETDFTRSAGRVAVYSDVLFRERNMRDSGGVQYRPELPKDTCTSQIAAGNVVVSRDDGTIRITDCR